MKDNINDISKKEWDEGFTNMVGKILNCQRCEICLQHTNEIMNQRKKEKVKDVTTENDFYSILSELLNNLEDDLQLDLQNGENGYKSYKDSYKAVRRYTLRILKKYIKKMSLQITNSQNINKPSLEVDK